MMTPVTSTEGRKRKYWLRAIRIIGGASFLFVAVGGFLHTKAGRPILAAMGVSCPAARVSPAEVESLRQRALTALRGPTPAASRPAFGLRLDASTEAEVVAWTKERGLACSATARPTRRLTCLNVPGSALPLTATRTAADELNFTFFPDGRLLGIETLRRTLTGESAAHLFATITTTLDAEVGEATERAGEPTAQYLDSAPMHTVFARYRYSDFLGTVTAMNLSGRVALREQYQSALSRT
jgi:hypothetical protein